MKTQTSWPRRWAHAAVISFTFSAASASAQLYWDSNDDTPGAGINPTGTWGANTFWSTDFSGSVVTGAWSPGASAIFSAGTDATNAYTVTISGGQFASSVIIEEGHVTFTGSQINIGAGSVVISPGAKLSIPNFVGGLTQSFVATPGAQLYLDGSTLRSTSNGGGLTFLDGDFTINLGPSGGIVETSNTGTNSSIFTGDIRGAGSVLVKTGPGEFRYQGAKSANANFAKLVVNEGTYRLGNVNGNNFETGFGAVPDVFTADAITLNGGAIATSWFAVDSVLHVNRGVTIGPNGGTIASALTIPGAITGSGPLTVTVSGAQLNGLNTFNGGITVTAGTTTIAAVGGMIAQAIAGAGSLTVNGVVSGGAITKTSTGTLTLNGANTYTGPTFVNAGILNVGSAEALGTINEDTRVAAGAELRIDGATKTFTTSEPLQIAGPGAGGGGAITIQNSATPTLAGRITLTEDATVTVSGVSTGTFTNPAAFTSLANHNLTLQGGSGTGSGGRITGAIALGSGGLTKLQGGTWTLSGANTYTGNTTISAGTLHFATRSSLYNGTIANWTDSKISVASGATLALNVGGAGEFTSADLNILSAIGSPTGGFASGAAIALDTTNAAGGSFTHAGNITNANALAVTKVGAGTLTLAGANTYTGTTTVIAGTLAQSATGSIADTSNLTVNGATAVFALGANHSDTVGTVTLQGGGSITGSGTSTLTVGAGTFALQSGSVSANLAGNAIPLNKTTTGTVTLSAANTYTGATTVAAGALLVNGTLVGTQKVDITGTLGGTGTIIPALDGSVTLLSGGRIAPGTSTGTLTVALSGTGIFDLRSGIDVSTGALEFELGALVASDKIVLSGGPLEIGNQLLNFDDFSFSALAGIEGGDYVLFDTSSPISGVLGASLTGTLNGFPAELQLADGGNDLVLHVVPEPGSFAVMLGGFAVLIGRRKRH